jgi:molybdate transport system ATP-binding protein
MDQSANTSTTTSSPGSSPSSPGSYTSGTEVTPSPNKASPPLAEPAPAILSVQASKMLQTAEGPRLMDISFSLAAGRLLAVYGPSGSGKTTLLRILAGLVRPEAGYIEASGQVWFDPSRQVNLPTRHRSIGFVFQDFALFPNLTVRKQLEFALPDRRDKALVDELLSLMELEELQRQRPAQLSGGQQQRVALARAIARRPKLLLLDEPLSALDEEMRLKLQEYLMKIHLRYGLTTLLVSHHLPEIFQLADEVIILEKGRIMGKGTPVSLFAGITGIGPVAPISNTGFSAAGEIIAIIPAGAVFIVSVRCAGTMINVTASAAEITGWKIGRQVVVWSDSFRPKILPAG